MPDVLPILVLTLAAIAAATVIAPRLGLPAPLVLLVLGIAVGALPAVGPVEVDPEWILHGLLPPLLYSAAVSMPGMSFRREFGPISGLSITLVVVSSLVAGALFAVFIPDLGFAWGVALGAIISPTDAVATSIIKGTGVPRRVVVILEGESLLNDATALVILRTAIVATVGAFSLWQAVGSFVWSLVAAIAVGLAVGWGNLAVRRRIPEPVVNTIVSFTVPFIAAIPAELLGASGLVAAVVAGLVTSIRAPRVLPPQHRMSDAQNWASIGLVLEGVIFITMGLQLRQVIDEVHLSRTGLEATIAFALLALVVLLLVRAAYIAPLLWSVARRADRGARIQSHFVELQARIDAGESIDDVQPPDVRRNRRIGRPPRKRTFAEEDLERVATRLRRAVADIDYLVQSPLGAREGAIAVWAGMRGAVTVAAAQTLPADTPHRSLLVLIAFTVATVSLLVQGGTIGWLTGKLFPTVVETDVRQTSADRAALIAVLRDAAEAVAHEDGQSTKERQLAILSAQRDALLDARDDGAFDADELEHALLSLDASQIAIEMRGGPTG